MYSKFYFSGGFIKEMKARQEGSQNYVVEEIGDILVNFVSIFSKFIKIRNEFKIIFKNAINVFRRHIFIFTFLAMMHIRAISKLFVPNFVIKINIPLMFYFILYFGISVSFKKAQPCVQCQ